MTHPLPPVDAQLLVDAGNTRIGVGVWDDDGLHDVRRVASSDGDAWRESIEHLWERTSRHRRRAVVVSSVSPRASTALREAVVDVCGQDALFIREDVALPLPVEPEYAADVGVDRVCSAAAAYDRVRDACAVASFGTAITVDCVSPEGRFLGGAILPGFELSFEALHEGTALLPQVEVAAPAGAFGRNTHDAIVNGVVYGAVGALREIVERFALDLNQWPQLVLTGGNAELVLPLANFVDSVVPDLCLMGVALAYRKASGQA